MTRHVVLLRGVNVGGSGRLPMAEFRAMLEALGCTEVKTYIQSGNAVFDHDTAADRLGPRIAEAIEARFGFRRPVLMLEPDDLREALTDHPFGAAPPEKVHVFFASEDQSGLDPAALVSFADRGEVWSIARRRVTLYTPDGLGTSKLADRLPKAMAGNVTARNLRSVSAILELALTHP